MISQLRRPLNTKGIGRFQITEIMTDNGQIGNDAVLPITDIFKNRYQTSIKMDYLT